MRSRLSMAFGFAALAASCAVPCRAVTLAPGDIVLVDSFYYPPAAPGLWRLDPATLELTPITAGGLLAYPDRIAVDRSHTIYVADRISGVLSIDPVTGTQSTLVSPAVLGGRTARGICLAADGTLYVTTTGSSMGQVLHVNQATGDVSVVSQDGLLVNPVGVTVGPDGALYVGDMSANSGAGSSGSIVRVETSGAQSVFANGLPFMAPYDVAISPDGWLWSAQWGSTSRRQGGFVRTRLSDGTSEIVPSDRSQGVVATPDGEVFLGDCVSISLDCYSTYRFVRRYSDGAQATMPSGGMAVVPGGATPTHRSTWGSLKAIYR